MTSANQSSNPAPLPDGQHLATISHDGHFWEVYLEFQDDPGTPTGAPTGAPKSFRGLLCFSPTTSTGAESAVRTTTILIEDSYETVVSKARAFEDFQLQSLLRSVLPDPE